MTTDSAIIDRLHAAAERIDVDLQLVDLLSPERALRDQAPARPRTPRVLAAAACLCLIAAVALALSTRRDPQVPAAQTEQNWTPPLEVPDGAPEPGSFAAHVPSPPDWLGDLGAGLRTSAFRSGRWVSTAIGRPTADGFASPITVSAFDGTWSALAEASTVEIDGATFLHAQIGEWQALATTTQPGLVAVGEVDQQTLHEALTESRISSDEDQFTITLTTAPDGYVEMVPPHALATDTSPRRTLAETGGALAINEVSDSVDPLLYAASTGADVRSHAIGTAVGWSGTTTSNPSGPITFLVWSPQPGVLFEVDSTDPNRTIEQLIQLAARTVAIPATEWDGTYPE